MVALRDSIQIDDISFASSSQLSHSVKRLNMSSILKQRKPKQVKVTADELSMRSSSPEDEKRDTCPVDSVISERT